MKNINRSVMRRFGVAFFAVVTLAFALQSVVHNSEDDTIDSAQATDLSTSTAVEDNVWHTSLDAALSDAKKRGTYVVVDAYADWCGWCKKLDKETLSDPSVRAKLKNFSLLKLNTDDQPKITRRYGIQGLPTTLVLNSDGELVHSQAGYMPPASYLKLLTSVNNKGR